MTEYYMQRGCRLTPIKPGTKRPLPTEWTRNTITTHEKVANYPGHAFGWVLDSDHLVIDVDPRNGGAQSLKKLSKKYSGKFILDYPCVITPSNGIHIYMTKPADLKIRKQIGEYPGIDFLSIGAQCLTVGSPHPDGGFYKFNQKSPHEKGPQPAPQWLLDEIKKTVEAPGGLRTGGSLLPSQIRDMLAQLDVTEYREHEKWLQILQACHDASDGAAMGEFLDWSLSDPEYAGDKDLIIQRWRSHKSGKSGNVTAGTLVHEVTSRGGTVPTPSAEDEADSIPSLPSNLPDTVGAILNDGRELQRCSVSTIEKTIDELETSGRADRIKPVLRMMHHLNRADRNRLIQRIAKHTGYKARDIQDLYIAEGHSPKGISDSGYEISTIVLNDYFQEGDYIAHAADQRFWSYQGTHWELIAPNMISHWVCNATAKYKGRNPDSRGTMSGLQTQAERILQARLATETDFHAVRGTKNTIINCRNGELHIDVKTGDHELKQHNPASFLTSCLPAEWDEFSECPRFESFLEEIFVNVDDRDDLIRHMWELIGYTIQPCKDLASWIMLTGEGSNGKTTLLKIMIALLGKHALSSSIPEITGDSHGMARLPGVLMLIDEDLDRDYQLPDGFLKKVSENKIISANPKFHPAFDFENTAIVWMACNDAPKTKDQTYGMLRRAHVIHFGKKFRKEERDRRLSQYIIDNELSGIFYKAVQALRRLRQRDEWERPLCVRDNVRRWANDASPMAFWTNSQLQKSTGARLLLRDAYTGYCLWASDQGISHKITKPMFSKALASAGYQFKNIKGNKRAIMDVEMLPPEVD